MSSGVPTHSATRTKSYAAALIADVDGIKTSFASATSDTTYVPADFNGAQVLTGGFLDFPRTVTISRSSSANAYSVNPIVVTGKRGSVTITESIAQPNDDGNDVLRGVKAFDSITSIFVPANAAGTGAFQFGVQDICAPIGSRFAMVKLHAAGTLNVAYGEDTTSPTDAIPGLPPEHEPISPTRILTSTALAVPTTVGLTVYMT